MALPEQTKTRITVEEFERYAELPENRDKRLEYHAGEVIEVVSNNLSSEIAATCIAFLGSHVIANKLGRMTGADGGYIINGHRYIPDAAFVSATRQPEGSDVAWNPVPPDLVIEVLSPSDQTDEVLDKVSNYLIAGVTVWLVDPDKQTVQVSTPGAVPRLLTIEDSIEGGEMLPGFSLPLRKLFR